MNRINFIDLLAHEKHTTDLSIYIEVSSVFRSLVVKSDSVTLTILVPVVTITLWMMRKNHV